MTIAPVPGEPAQADVRSDVATVARVTASVQTTEGSVTGEGTIRFHVVTVATITVIPSSTTIPVGRTMRFTATPRDELGGHQPDALVTWSTSDPDVTVTPYALNPHQADVRSFIEADAIVTASVGEVSGSAPIRFFSTGTCPPVDHVQIAITDGLIEVGERTSLQAIPKDASGNTLSTTGCAIEWSTTAGLSLAIDPGNPAAAVGTAESPGTVTVMATVGGTAGSVTITVQAAGAGN